MSSFWLCGSRVVYPIIYGLVPSPPRLNNGVSLKVLFLFYPWFTRQDLRRKFIWRQKKLVCLQKLRKNILLFNTWCHFKVLDDDDDDDDDDDVNDVSGTFWGFLDVLFRYFRFSKASFNAWHLIHNILKLRCHLGTKTYGRLP